MAINPSSDKNKMPRDVFLSIIEEARNYVRYISEVGDGGIDISKENIQVIENWGHAEIPLKEMDSLEKIQEEIIGCRRCLISQDASSLVFGKGPSNAKVMFVGNWPDAATEKAGIPFSGDAGELLSKIIKAMRLDIREVYLCNILKCRPKNDKPPLMAEVNECLSILKRQLNVIKPVVICTLGTFSSQIILNTKEPLLSLRGKFHDFGGIKVMPTFHPSTLLKDPGNKRDTWEDVQKIMAFLGL